jgi:hypothetical protein
VFPEAAMMDIEERCGDLMTFLEWLPEKLRAKANDAGSRGASAVLYGLAEAIDQALKERRVKR